MKKLDEAKCQKKKERQQIKKRQIANKKQLMEESSSDESGRKWGNDSCDKGETEANEKTIAEEQGSGENENNVEEVKTKLSGGKSDEIANKKSSEEEFKKGRTRFRRKIRKPD